MKMKNHFIAALMPKRNFSQRQNTAHYPNGIFSDGRPPLLVQMKFSRPADCRWLSKRNFCFQTKNFCSADAKAVKKQKIDARADAKSPSERKDAI